MQRGSSTIAQLSGLIGLLGVVLAGVRSGSNDWFALIYTATFLALVLAAIVARYRGAGWYGFAVAGWAYFLVGFPPGADPHAAVNRHLFSIVIVELGSGIMAPRDLALPGATGLGGSMMRDLHRANREGVCHCALTILFGLAGGLVARAAARRPRSVGGDPPIPAAAAGRIAPGPPPPDPAG